MAGVLETVATGEVTQAVRDASTPAGPVREGQWMGLVRGDGVVAVGDGLADTCRALLDHVLHPSHELLTVIAGQDADPAVTAEVIGWLAEQHPGVETEVHRGGQPLYPYLFGAE